MTRKLVIGSVCLAVLGVARDARAQQATTSSLVPTDLSAASFDPANAVAPVSIVEGPGVKVGEGTVIHPVFGLETGFVSNVFYNEVAEGAGVLRLLGQIGMASLNQSRLDPYGPNVSDDDTTDTTNKGDFQYNASVRLAYDQPLSGNEQVTSTGGLGIGASLHGLVNPMGKFSFGFDENFIRLIRASNFETATNENRDVNNLTLMLHYRPQTSSISGYLYYRNLIDIFESSDTLYPSRQDHRLGLHPMWKWLPQTYVYGDVSGGVVTGLGSSMESAAKNTSFPLIVRAGITSLLTLKTSVNVSAGYTNGFYTAGPSFSAPVVDAVVAYRYSPMGKVQLGYSLQYQDSVNANYYRDHIARLTIQQLFVPFALLIQPELHLREYNGTIVLDMNGRTVRDDLIFVAVAGMYYNFRNWAALTLNYRLSTLQTDFSYLDVNGGVVDPSYVRHDLLLGMRVAM